MHLNMLFYILTLRGIKKQLSVDYSLYIFSKEVIGYLMKEIYPSIKTELNLHVCFYYFLKYMASVKALCSTHMEIQLN